MRLRHYSVMMLSLLLSFPVAGHSTRVRRGPTSARAKHTKSTAGKKKAPGQRGIDSERATQIQSALIKAGYMQGTPSGQWDNQTAAAMQKMQADNGWQTKITPDSRALIKLGLGPTNTTTASLNPTPTPLKPATSANSTIAK
jgi:hypothetical protein